MILLLNTRISVNNIRYTKSDQTHHSVVGTHPESKQLVSKKISVSRGWAVTDIDTNTKTSSKFACVRRQELL